jgi:histidine triad (HIT) family protein
MRTYDPDCDFCGIVARQEDAREVFRTEHLVGFFPLEPATLGHTLLIPREHIPDIWALDDQTAGHLARATLTLANAIREGMNPDGLNIIQSNGEAATQTVPHLHVHLVPRWENDGMGRIWPDETDWSEQAKDDACGKVRAAYNSQDQREPQ